MKSRNKDGGAREVDCEANTVCAGIVHICSGHNRSVSVDCNRAVLGVGGVVLEGRLKRITVISGKTCQCA